MTRNIEVLFGDDQFADVQTRCIFKNDYISELNKQVPGIQFNWNCQTDHLETIREAETRKYHVVVTDLQYTTNGHEGYEVVDAVSRLIPKPLLILCTNSEVEQRADQKIDFIARPGGKCFHKFDALIKVLADQYQKEADKK